MCHKFININKYWGEHQSSSRALIIIHSFHTIQTFQPQPTKMSNEDDLVDYEEVETQDDVKTDVKETKK